MKAGELIEYLKKVPGDFIVTGMIQSPVSEEDLNKRSYKYPYDLINCKIEVGDIGYSDKKIRLDFIIED